MKRLAVLLPLLFQPAFAQTQWSMGFWTGVTGQPLSDLPWGGLTHIAHVGAAPNSDGSLTLTCSIGPCATSLFASEVSTLISAAHANNVKVLLDLGNVSGSLWSGAAGNNLGTFVNNIMSVVNTYGYDGVDLDWEQSFNASQMTNLLNALRQRLGTKLLAADISAGDGAYWGTVHGYLDRVNVMTYDMVGTWNPYSWFNAALYNDPCNCVWSVELARQRVTAAGVPASKLNIGIPFYGWTSTGAGNTAPRQAYSGTPNLSQINYSQIATNYNISTPSWDSLAQVPWIPISNGWLTFDNEQSVAAKVNYAKSNNLGGWIIWEIEQDYLPTRNPKHPLLTAIKNAMGPTGSPTPPSITSASPLAAGTIAVAYSQTIASGGTTPITFSISGGGLPAGLSLSPSGLISGLPLSAGTSTFTVQAANSAGTNAKQFSLTINSLVTAPTITSISPLTVGILGVLYVQALVSIGTTPTWSITSGALPAGVSLVPATGVITGIPTVSGTFSFTIQASNSAGSNSKQFSLTVNGNNPPPSGAVGQFVRLDTTTKGNWKQAYGADGYSIPNYLTSLPSYSQVALTGQSNWTWADPSTDVRAMQKVAASGRLATTWFDDNSFRIDVNLTDGVLHQVALYCLDWDGNNRLQRVEVLDAATGSALDSRSVNGFTGGQYVVWNVKGHVVIQVTTLSSSNTVASGLFFGGAVPITPTATATFVKTDTKTQGSWKRAYGSNGEIIANDSNSIPSYSQVQFASQSAWTWVDTTTDVRALQKAASRQQRIASAWFGSSFTVDINLTDSTAHQVALYFLDWNAGGRTQSVKITDANTDQVLDTRNLSDFSQGQYLVWNLSGHVVIEITVTGGANALLSGVFF